MVGQLIGFVGLGRMGSALAERLLDGGYDLAVFDPSPVAVSPFEARGALALASPRDIADRAPIVFACLPTIEASRDVAFGRQGVLHGSSIRHYVETSTVGRITVQEISNALAERAIDTIDVPVSGGPSGAKAGKLSLIVSGAPQAIDAVSGPLECLSHHRFVVGPEPGQAQMCKLVNNAISLVGMALACEAVVLGVKAGLDPTTLLAVINNSTGRNSATAEKFPAAVLTRTFDYGGPIGAGPKDLNLFLEEADLLGVPAEITQAGTRLWEIAVSEGDPNRDFTRIIQTLERWAGVEVDGRSRGTEN